MKSFLKLLRFTIGLYFLREFGVFNKTVLILKIMSCIIFSLLLQLRGSMAFHGQIRIDFIPHTFFSKPKYPIHSFELVKVDYRICLQRC